MKKLMFVCFPLILASCKDPIPACRYSSQMGGSYCQKPGNSRMYFVPSEGMDKWVTMHPVDWASVNDLLRKYCKFPKKMAKPISIKPIDASP